MSVRLFAGYFLVLAACATLAFASSQAGSPAAPATADAGFMPITEAAFPVRPSGPAASFRTRPRKTAAKRLQIAEAE